MIERMQGSTKPFHSYAKPITKFSTHDMANNAH